MNENIYYDLSMKKTIYTIVDESGENSSITINKYVADILQAELDNVHSWIQQQYNKVVNRHPSISRRKKGDYVRILAEREAAPYMTILF